MPHGLKRYHDFEHDHFITFTCYHRLRLLDSSAAYTTFETILEACRQRYRCCIYAYVLMPDHVHLLLSKPLNVPLATMLNVLKTQTSRQLKATETQFWQTRYYDRNIYSLTEFVEKRRYIHRNPVEEGLALELEDWPWSSYRRYFTGEPGRVTVATHFADSPD